MRTKSLTTAVAAAVVLLCATSTATHAQNRTIIVKNNCTQTVWPGIFEQGQNGAPPPSPQPMGGGWALSSGQSTTLTLPSGFAGRIWARKDCTFDASGKGQCETGDCGGVLQCAGATGRAGTSLAEFTLYEPNNLTQFPQDWYDVSYVDGYDFPVAITPSNASYMAPNVSFDMLPTCPAGQQVKNAQGVVVECLTACTRYGTDPTVPASVQQIYCCAPPYNSAAQCNPSNYPNSPGNLNAPFKAAAPNSYSWSDDDPTSVWHYNGDSTVTYTVTFCPTNLYGATVQTSGTGSYNGPTSVSGSWNQCGGSTGGGTTGTTTGSTTGGSSTTSTMIDCGGAASGTWSADAGFSGGTAVTTTAAINLAGAPSPAPTQAVMQSERDGNVTYTITGLTANSKHTVDLYFSENNFTSAGQRQFNVSIQGTPVLGNFDVYATAGGQYKAIEQSFTATASSTGQIVIALTTVKYNAEINAIAIQ